MAFHLTGRIYYVGGNTNAENVRKKMAAKRKVLFTEKAGNLGETAMQKGGDTHEVELRTPSKEKGGTQKGSVSPV